MGKNRSSPLCASFQKSVLLKKGGRGAQYQDETCVVSLWRGDESFKHVQNAITRFCQTYAFVQGVDVAMTESVKATRKEAELWIGGAQYQDETCVVSLWRGDESFKHIQNAITRFCQTYAFVQGVDVAMTESVKATRKEAELWIGPLTSAPAPEPPPAPSDEASPSNEPPNMNEEAAEGEDANATNDETPPVDSSPPVHDPNDVVLMRESSTADTTSIHLRTSTRTVVIANYQQSALDEDQLMKDEKPAAVQAAANTPSFDYDFPLVVGVSRAIQFLCCIVQYKCRYYNIDGRFDLRQLMREPENTVKIQYSIALFTPMVLSTLLFVCVENYYGATKVFWFLTCAIEMVLSTALFGLESYEVFWKGN
ncbi:unnamed protein product [Nippostrongylus brasiliensis]|uniref:TIR domain-containing protein n=1 Tax=Nippostrongylus brasiliensis TaxID=27835 RepID=A0A0N4YVY4_NIPBR|nr:unnamed protein product [Nippostrongylus brasiliensis]